MGGVAASPVKRPLRCAARLVLAATVLGVGSAACGLVPAGQAGTAHTLTLPAARSSVLIVITDQGSPADLATAGALISRSVRAGQPSR